MRVLVRVGVDLTLLFHSRFLSQICICHPPNPQNCYMAIAVTVAWHGMARHGTAQHLTDAGVSIFCIYSLCHERTCLLSGKILVLLPSTYSVQGVRSQ